MILVAVAVLADLADMRRALEAVFQVAAVAHEGDPWYCENAEIDVGAAFSLARRALAAADGTRTPIHADGGQRAMHDDCTMHVGCRAEAHIQGCPLVAA